jgi:uncharacterized protein involved in exopolysaccharide biosynthesis
MLREETRAIPPQFDAADYLLYIRRRWRVVAVACAVAGTLALGASLLLPNRYTSTASILIEPPAGTDPRSFMAISPVYLESLRTYERIALSDSLFLRALERFKLFEPGGSHSVEQMKRRVLKVSKVRDTKILELSVTLKDPKEAQAMAQFLAEETVKLSSTATRDAGQDVMDTTRRQQEEARVKLEEARAAWTRQLAEEPVETLRQEIGALVELQQRLRRNVAEAQGAAAQYEARAKAATNDAEFLAQEGASHRARAQQLTIELQKVEQSIQAKDRLIGRRAGRLDAAEGELKLAQARFAAAAERAENLQSSVGLAGERLRVIDPGIVPQRPSEPKKALNMVIAVSLALLGSTIYLTLAYNFR